MATQGFANYLKKNFKDREQISTVVCYDCRNNSDLYARTVANIFSANGIKVYLFDEMRPTPECSFAIRHFGAQGGVNLTASHNPREYNGYKAYWEDGAQVLAPHDKGIIDEVGKVTIADVKFEGNNDLIQMVGADVDAPYLEQIKTICPFISDVFPKSPATPQAASPSGTPHSPDLWREVFGCPCQ